jgi:cyclohexyl-isocyanide hydratase
MDRRNILKAISIASAGLLANASASAADKKSEMQSNFDRLEQDHLKAMNSYADFMSGKRLQIGMVIYPGMFLLDLIGPLTIFESLMNRDIYLIWKNLNSVNDQKTDYASYIPIKPTTTFQDCPKDLDILFVPGGVPATMEMMQDQELLQFLAEQGKTAKYITSVCTGSLILGAAGLLNGYKATSHWMTMEALPELGAIPTKGRVVVDRNRITGGGVTAGMDFGLLLIGILRNKEYAQAVQLYLEYDPDPPFNSGSPIKAPKRVRSFVFDMMRSAQDFSIETARKIRKQYPGRFKI